MSFMEASSNSNEELEAILNNLIIVGDRVLIKPLSLSDTTRSGLYLPPGVAEKEKVHSGYVIKAGPGYPIPLQWKKSRGRIEIKQLNIFHCRLSKEI